MSTSNTSSHHLTGTTGTTGTTSTAAVAVEEFMAKAGHHDTSVHERVAPAVVHETIIPSRHENVTTAIDKEIHQDHYHTSVQPIVDREVKAEKHVHNVVAVENREFEHGNSREVEQRLAEEAALFKDERIVNETKHTHSVAPVIAGEHIHHHVHETIQPVIQREVIAPTVVHTTVPIHEVHHNAAQHHATSALPAVSLSDFKRQGGVLTGREERYDGFEGEPKSVGGALSGGADQYTTTSHHTGAAGAGISSHIPGTAANQERKLEQGRTGGSATQRMENKLDPRTDADHDGKRGVME